MDPREVEIIDHDVLLRLDSLYFLKDLAVLKMTQIKEKKEHCSVPLTACCPKPKKDIENVSMTNASDCNDKDSVAYSERSSLVINDAASVFQGPNVQVDLEFKDLSYEVKIRKGGMSFLFSDLGDIKF